MPIYGHMYFGHNSANFWPNTKIKVSLYSGEWYLSFEHHKSWIWRVLHCFGIFGQKMGVAATLAPEGLGPQNPTKNLAHWVDILGQWLSRNHVFKISRHEPPHPPLNCKKCTFSILAFLITSLGNIFHYFYSNFLIYNRCVQDNRILHGKENQVILHWDIQAQKWQH